MNERQFLGGGSGRVDERNCGNDSLRVLVRDEVAGNCPRDSYRWPGTVNANLA